MMNQFSTAQKIALIILSAAPVTLTGQIHQLIRLPWKLADMALFLGIFVLLNWLLAKYAVPTAFMIISTFQKQNDGKN